MPYKIFFSNLGYARGIDGSLQSHITKAGRNFYCPVPAQKQVLFQAKELITAEDPDVCCFVEIAGHPTKKAILDQIEELTCENYPYYDVSCKYGGSGWAAKLPLHKGKNNAFMAKTDIPHKTFLLRHGTKKLVYALEITDDITLFFAHFSLRYQTRQNQLSEMAERISTLEKNTILMADFNILRGLGELDPFLKQTGLKILNGEDEPTFSFHRRKLVLDLCLCSNELADSLELRIVPQPFSDHAALVAEIRG